MRVSSDGAISFAKESAAPLIIGITVALGGLWNGSRSAVWRQRDEVYGGYGSRTGKDLLVVEVVGGVGARDLFGHCTTG